MRTEERPAEVEQDSSRTSENQNLQQADNTTKFIFDAALSTAVAANGQRPTKASQPDGPLTPEMLGKMNRYWRARCV